jgi:hypothetical protein
MAQYETPRAGAYATADRSGQPVINDHAYVLPAGLVNGDLVKIGELPAHHQLLPELSAVFALADGAAQLAACNIDIFIGDVQAAGNTVVDNLAVTADTEARTALSTHLPSYKLGTSQENRSIWVLFNTAPATAEGTLVFRSASFTK